ncbi:MAG TPA: hypothetical protein VF263_08840 [Longimicrobiaceae bacterium]
MLVIRRTEGGGLRLTDRKRTETVPGEEQARRTLTSWGYAGFSINKALIQMKEAEGSLAPADPWAAVRGRAPETPAPAPVTESAPPPPIKEPPTMNAPVRSRRPRAAAERAAEAPVVEASADPPVAEAVPPRKRARKAPAAEKEPAAPAPEPAAEEPKPAVRPKRARSAKPAAAAEAPAAPAAAPEPVEAPAAPAARKRAPRVRAPEPAAAARGPEEWLEAARALFAEGTQSLKEIERTTLPFARGPWTELREKSAEILACLQGGTRPRQ